MLETRADWLPQATPVTLSLIATAGLPAVRVNVPALGSSPQLALSRLRL